MNKFRIWTSFGFEQKIVFEQNSDLNKKNIFEQNLDLNKLNLEKFRIWPNIKFEQFSNLNFFPWYNSIL
jgi:hypothetical protein